MTKLQSAITCCTLVLVCGLAFIVRAPLISVDLPFIYEEDDGHHFNRSVEMYKRGSLDPIDYFNKPSLHFYLRFPIHALATRDAISHGELSSAAEIRTRDPYGLSQFAFTVSHPRILIWNRAWSVFLSIILVLLTFVVANQVLSSIGYAAFAALASTFSLEVVRNSHIIGVDVLMAVMCLLSTISALTFYKTRPNIALLVSAIFAGLAASSKYNAAPIAVIPALVSLIGCSTQTRIRAFAIATCTTVISFLAASPYILIHFAEAVHDIKYELWHYGVAGHEGHSTDRGLSQAIFYLNWLTSDGVGVPLSCLALVGVIPMCFSSDRTRWIFLAFPLLYCAMMIFQKTNFTRNMVVLVPYVGVVSAFGLRYATSSLKKSGLAAPITTLIAAITLFPLAVSALLYVSSRVHQPDSRRELLSWITTKPPMKDLAASGELQLPIGIFAVPGVDSFNPAKTQLLELIQAGYSALAITSGESSLPASLKDAMTPSMIIPGSISDLRIPKDPPIQLLEWNVQDSFEMATQLPATVTKLSIPQLHGTTLGCERHQEKHCWLRGRHNLLELDPGSNDSVTIPIRITTLWGDQHIQMVNSTGSVLIKKRLVYPNESFDFTVIGKDFPLTIIINQIHSPKEAGLGTDVRRLGARIQRITTP